MQKKYFIGVLVLLSSFYFSQKIKNNIIYNGKEPIAKIKIEGCNYFADNCVYYINNLEDKPLMTIAYLKTVNSLRLGYMRYVFNNINKPVELSYSGLYASPKQIVKTIINNNLIEGNALNEASINNFSNLYGERYSDKESNSQEVFLIK